MSIKYGKFLKINKDEGIIIDSAPIIDIENTTLNLDGGSIQFDTFTIEEWLNMDAGSDLVLKSGSKMLAKAGSAVHIETGSEFDILEGATINAHISSGSELYIAGGATLTIGECSVDIGDPGHAHFFFGQDAALDFNGSTVTAESVSGHLQFLGRIELENGVSPALVYEPPATTPEVTPPKFIFGKDAVMEFNAESKVALPNGNTISYYPAVTPTEVRITTEMQYNDEPIYKFMNPDESLAAELRIKAVSTEDFELRGPTYMDTSGTIVYGAGGTGGTITLAEGTTVETHCDSMAFYNSYTGFPGGQIVFHESANIHFTQNCYVLFDCNVHMPAGVSIGNPDGSSEHSFIGSANFTGDVVFNNKVTFNGDTDFNIGFDFSQPVTFNSTVIFNDDITFNLGFDFDQPVTFDNTTTFNGANNNFAGTTSTDFDTGSSVAVGGTLSIENRADATPGYVSFDPSTRSMNLVDAEIYADASCKTTFDGETSFSNGHVVFDGGITVDFEDNAVVQVATGADFQFGTSTNCTFQNGCTLHVQTTAEFNPTSNVTFQGPVYFSSAGSPVSFSTQANFTAPIDSTHSVSLHGGLLVDTTAAAIDSVDFSITNPSGDAVVVDNEISEAGPASINTYSDIKVSKFGTTLSCIEYTSSGASAGLVEITSNASGFNVSCDASFSGTTTFSGDVNFDLGFDFGQPVTFNNSATFNGDVIFNTSFEYTQPVQFDNTASFLGDYVNINPSVATNITSGELTVGASVDTVFHGGMHINNETVIDNYGTGATTDLTVNGRAAFNSDSSFSSHVYVSGSYDFTPQTSLVKLRYLGSEVQANTSETVVVYFSNNVEDSTLYIDALNEMSDPIPNTPSLFTPTYSGIYHVDICWSSRNVYGGDQSYPTFAFYNTNGLPLDPVGASGWTTLAEFPYYMHPNAPTDYFLSYSFAVPLVANNGYSWAASAGGGGGPIYFWRQRLSICRIA